MVLTNDHPQARDTMSRRVEQEEEQADRLGRTLMNCEEPFLVRRMGNSLETMAATVCATIRHEFRSVLTVASRPDLVFLFLSGHGFWSEESGPVLLARDVYLHIREEGEIPLRDLLSLVVAAEPRHPIIALDFRCLRSDTPVPSDLAASLGDIPGSHSLFILDRSKGFGLGLAGALAGAGHRACPAGRWGFASASG